MAYFPFFIDLEGKEGLIIGGGTVALRKIEKLLPYGPVLTVAAPEISPEIRQIEGLRLLFSEFEEEQLQGKTFAIAATNRSEINHRVYEEGMRRGIPVNAVDDKKNCSFLFPSLVKNGPLSIGISTSGTSPSAAIWMKQQIHHVMPENMGDILRDLENLRPLVKTVLSREEDRKQAFSMLYERSICTGIVPEQTELIRLLDEIKSEESHEEK